MSISLQLCPSMPTMRTGHRSCHFTPVVDSSIFIMEFIVPHVIYHRWWLQKPGQIHRTSKGFLALEHLRTFREDSCNDISLPMQSFCRANLCPFCSYRILGKWTWLQYSIASANNWEECCMNVSMTDDTDHPASKLVWSTARMRY